MLRGIWPRGSSSAPGNGNTGMISGKSPGPRYSALIGIGGPGADETHSYARAVIAQPAAAVGPLAVLLYDLEQLPGRLAAVAAGIERGCEIGTRLMIERVGGDFLF